MVALITKMNEKTDEMNEKIEDMKMIKSTVDNIQMEVGTIQATMVTKTEFEKVKDRLESVDMDLVNVRNGGTTMNVDEGGDGGADRSVGRNILLMQRIEILETNFKKVGRKYR